MRKGSLKLLLSMALLAIGTTVYAASPVISQLPIVVISDHENNLSGTQDWNLFVFTDAFSFADYATDADTPAGNLKWTFMVGAGGTGSLTINGIDPITDSADALNPTTPLNGSATTATFRETTLSPTSGTAPYPTPTAITSSLGAPTDINLDGTDDTLVGELVITLLAADDQGTVDGLDTADTFVWTYDTDLTTTPATDDLVDAGMPFTDLPLEIGTDDPPAPGSPDWYYRAWSAGGGSSTLTANWLNDSTSGTTGGPTPYSSFTITGAGSSTKPGSIGGASYGEWIAPGDATALFAPGKVYSVRAAMGQDVAKTSNDSPRIGIQENTVANVNQTYVINAPTNVSGIGDSPFLPAAGSTKQYLSTEDPIDADVTANSTTGDGNDVYYLLNFDYINLIDAATITGSLTSYEVGNSDSTTYNQNQVQVTNGRYGAGYNEFDDWGFLQGGALPLVGGGTVLTGVQSYNATTSEVTIVTPNTADGTANIAFAEMTNFAGTANVDDLQVTQGAAYRADYSIAMDGGSAPGVSVGNTYGIPALRLRTATPIPSFSIEYIVTPRNTNAFPTEGTVSTISMYWTASTQFADGTSVGEENDAQMVFGVMDFEWTDGTATLSGLRVYELNSSDPNVDY